jgi:hypothetical protein
MTVFGWFYLLLTIIGGLMKISEIGKPRKPVTQGDAMAVILMTGLLFWGLYAWGLHS